MVSGVFTCSTMQRNCAPMATRNRRVGTSGMVVYCLTQLSHFWHLGVMFHGT